MNRPIKSACPVGYLLVSLLGLACASGFSLAAASDSDALILNQANTVSGGKYLDGSLADPTLGRLEGNGQNWLELLTTKTDPGKNTLDIQGWSIAWSYNKDSQDYGSGTITFSNDPLWAAVPLGTTITINEDQAAWYLLNTPPYPKNGDGDPDNAGGLQRDGDINGVGVLHGSAYTNNPAVEKLVSFATNTAWNPLAQTGPNWNINVSAGQLTAQHQFQYFSFTGTVVDKGVAANIGTDAGGLFVANNDNWQFTIRDAQGSIVEGPIGEALAGWTSSGVGPTQLVNLQGFAQGTNPTLANYQTVTIANYGASSLSDYGGPSQWTAHNVTATEDLSPLHSWFNSIPAGDVNLDGIVNIADLTEAGSHWLESGAGLLSGDANGDGIVNIADLTLIGSHWLDTTSGGTSQSVTLAPEPPSFMLAVCALIAGGIVRRKIMRSAVARASLLAG